MPPKPTRDSEAIKTLKAWFQSGKLTKRDKPADVQRSHDLFKAYKSTTFRARFNEVKRAYCRDNDLKPDQPGEDLDRRCSLRDTSSAKKRKFADIPNDSEAEDEENIADSGGEELLSSPFIFKNLYFISSWQELETTTERMSIAILLTSGIGLGDFSLRVVNSGKFIELTAVWPAPPMQMSVLHKKLLSDPAICFNLYHPKVVGFEQALRELRNRTSEKIESVARVPLPFFVQTDIDH